MDEFTRLMRQPRICRCCGKECKGKRCRECFSTQGFLIRSLSDGGKTEQTLQNLYMLENGLRALESQGQVFEKDGKWQSGLHPEQKELWAAWHKRQKEMTEC